MWVDTNVHLELMHSDPSLILERAKRVSVSVVATGTHPEQWQWLQVQQPSVKTYGLHPSYASRRFNPDELIRFLKSDKEVHLGEIGLDYRPEYSDRKRQYLNFSDQLEIAKQFNRAVIIHSVKAHFDVLKALKKHAFNRFVVHAFSGSKDIAMQYLALGGYLSFGGVLLATSPPRVIRCISEFPATQLLIETNAPHLAPRNLTKYEPMHLPLIGEALAKFKNRSVDQLAKQLRINASNLFNCDFD